MSEEYSNLSIPIEISYQEISKILPMHKIIIDGSATNPETNKKFDFIFAHGASGTSLIISINSRNFTISISEILEAIIQEEF